MGIDNWMATESNGVLAIVVQSDGTYDQRALAIMTSLFACNTLATPPVEETTRTTLSSLARHLMKHLRGIPDQLQDRCPSSNSIQNPDIILQLLPENT